MNHHKLYKHCKILSFIFVLFLAISCGAKDIVFDSYTGQAMYSGYNPYGPPYGAKVKCDAELPMDELRQCITDSYLAMDKKRMTPWEQEERKTEKLYKEERYSKYKKYNFPDTHTITYTEVPEFKSIKECYEKNKCYIPQGPVAYDNYKRLLSIKSIDSIHGIMSEKCNYYPDSLEKDVIRCRTNGFTSEDCNYPKLFGEEQNVLSCSKRDVFGLGRITYRHFTRSYHSKKKDLVSFYDGELNVYTAGLEVVRLNRGKNLVAIRILEFRPMNPEKEGYEFNGRYYYHKSMGGAIKKESVKYQLSPISGFTIWDIREDDIQEIGDNLAISLDKREYPTKIYINTGAKVYEVPIPKEEDKIQNK